MLSGFIAWLNVQTPSTAAFIGTLIGSGIGLLAILVGDAFGSHTLNWCRDDRLRNHEKIGVLLAIRSELQNIRKALFDNLECLGAPGGANYLVPDIATAIKIFPVFIPRLSLLDGETVEKLYEAYWLIDEYSPKLVLLGGVKNLKTDSDRTRSIQMPLGTEKTVMDINKSYVKKIDKTLECLNGSLGEIGVKLASCFWRNAQSSLPLNRPRRL